MYIAWTSSRNALGSYATHSREFEYTWPIPVIIYMMMISVLIFHVM